MKLFPGCILLSKNDSKLFTIVKFKNNKTATIRNNNTSDIKNISIKDIAQDYTILKPHGYVSFNIVDLKDGLQDVIVSLFRNEDLDKTPSVPYAVCRQCIIDFLYQQINPDTEYTGISISQDTCPANVDFGIMLSCNGIHDGYMVAVYMNYTLDYILSFIKTKEFDDVLYCDLMDHAKSESNKYGNFIYNNIINSDVHMGYCKDLKTLLKINNFMYDFYRAFNIYNIDFTGLSEREGKSLNAEEVNTLSTLLCKNIIATIIVKYNYDIDLNNINQSSVLIVDPYDNLYVIGYAEDKSKPYEVPVESVESPNNIYKLNDVMTKAGKKDSNIRRAYDHLIFDSSKYN